jgi:integrase
MANDSDVAQAQAASKPARDKDGLHKRRGYWYYSLKINGHRRFFGTGTKAYRAAKAIFQLAQREYEEGRLPSTKAKLTLNKAADNWMERRTLDGKAENTIRTDRERLQPVRKYFGQRRLLDITLDEIYEYRRSRINDAGPRTINLEVKVIRMILTDAKCWSKIEADYKSLKENRRGPGVALDGAGLAHLIAIASSKPEWEAAFLAAWVAANTTMRGGEIKQLRHRSVDHVAGMVHIERQSTKTDAGCREIPLNDEAKYVFTILMHRANRLGSSEPDHFLFPAAQFRKTKDGASCKGTGYDPTRPVKTWRTAWRTLRVAAGFPAFRFHDLRHTAITSMAINGVPIPTIMAVAGHLSPEMTRHYTHVSSQAKAAAVAKLGVFRSEADGVSDTKPEIPLAIGEAAKAAPSRARVHSRVHPGAVMDMVSINASKHWSGRGDLNARPPAPKAGALPGCATPRRLLH